MKELVGKYFKIVTEDTIIYEKVESYHEEHDCVPECVSGVKIFSYKSGNMYSLYLVNDIGLFIPGKEIKFVDALGWTVTTNNIFEISKEEFEDVVKKYEMMKSLFDNPEKLVGKYFKIKHFDIYYVYINEIYTLNSHTFYKGSTIVNTKNTLGGTLLIKTENYDIFGDIYKNISVNDVLDLVKSGEIIKISEEEFKKVEDSFNSLKSMMC